MRDGHGNEDFGSYQGIVEEQRHRSLFSTVVASKRITIKDLALFKSALLNITLEEEALVQARLPDAVDQRHNPRAHPLAHGDVLARRDYMDNDVQVLLDHLEIVLQLIHTTRRQSRMTNPFGNLEGRQSGGLCPGYLGWICSTAIRHLQRHHQGNLRRQVRRWCPQCDRAARPRWS